MTSPADATRIDPRWMKTILDPEWVLPPPPASTTPTDASGSSLVANANRGRRVFEFTKTTATTVGSDALVIDVSIGVWRPRFYDQRFDCGSRCHLTGIVGTHAGVDKYFTHVSCATPATQIAEGWPASTPANARSAGDLPRQSRRLTLAEGSPCTVALWTSNAHHERTVKNSGPTRRDNELSDPTATVTWVAELSAGTNVVRTSESLVEDAFVLYTFTARRGYTYSFCTYPSTANACSDESSGDNDAQMLIVGPAGEVTKPSDQRDENGLTWTAPKSSSAKTTYTLVVRRRERVEGTVPNYSYRLKYTIEEIGSCALLNIPEVSVCIPPKPTPSVSSRTHNTVTISWPSSSGDGSTSFTVKHVTGANCDAEGTETTFTPDSANADGVRGAGNQDIQYTFPNLTPSTSYKLCVRSVRTISPSFVLKSDWASVPATTRAEQLPKPGGTSVTNVGQNSLTLNWGAVADAGGYKVKRTGSSSTWTLPSTSRSHRFTGLSSGTYYTLYVQALPKAGSSKVASAWAPKSRHTNSALPPPTPQPPPPQPTPSLTECLSTVQIPTYATWLNNGSHCRSATASALWDALEDAGKEIGCIGLALTSFTYVYYQRSGSGWFDFALPHGFILWLSSSACPTGSGVSGSADAGALNCAEAAKPETGPAVVSVGGAACVIVRGGAAQVSDGEHSLDLTLPNGRDWVLFAASEFTGSSAGAFWVYDMASGGWIALYPPDGAELERYAPAGAEGLPALLDAIAGSAGAPAAE